MDTAKQDFIRRLTAHQSRLYSYILSLIFDSNAAQDVLQETNVVIWEKLDEAMQAKSFESWAYGVAKYKVLSYVRDLSRDRHFFDAELVSMIAADAESVASDVSERISKLESCLEHLGPSERRLIADRYERSRPMQAIAERAGKSVSAVKQSLYRIRLALLECIHRKEALEGGK